MKQAFSLLAILAAAPAFAEESRQLEAHEHGVGVLNIAIEGTTVAMEFQAPGADIVGFEYEAESEVDLAAIDTAVMTLAAPLDLFALPSAAACTVTTARAELEGEEDHDEHKDEADHDDHAKADHDEHDEHEEGHEDHAEDDHEGHDDHKDHEDHNDHEGEEHTEEAGHTEFHANYTLNCENPDALTTITFAYFDAFPNAKEVEVQIITATGAQAFEVERDAPVLDLGR